MDKQILLDQLVDQLRASARAALSASGAAAEAAIDSATPSEKREDARAAIEFGSLAGAQSRRARRALAEIDALSGFRLEESRPGQTIRLGSVVEVEDLDTSVGRTFFLAPVGAGITLAGPDGDGVFSVVTPASPVGRAVVGRREGDVVEVNVDGEVHEWTITWVA